MGMLANAASPVIYRQVFHEDFMKQTREFENEENPELFQKMGFIMMKQAQDLPIRELMTNITIDEYYEWLVQFEPLEIILATREIAELYYGQQIGSSSPKVEGA